MFFVADHAPVATTIIDDPSLQSLALSVENLFPTTEHENSVTGLVQPNDIIESEAYAPLRGTVKFVLPLWPTHVLPGAATTRSASATVAD